MSLAHRISAPFLAVIATLVVAGCSNGGSSSSSAPPTRTPSNPPSSTVEIGVDGAATKGVMQFARVTAYELDGSARQLRKVGETETDEDGSYQLTLFEDYKPGVMEIVVSVIDGRTRMICDASQCGDAFTGGASTLPSDFTLHALIAGSSDQTKLSASVSPWTDMAAERARALLTQGKALSDAVRQATAEINELLGFNLGKTRSRGLSQLKGAANEEAQYAILNAAAAEIIFAGGELSTERLRAFARVMNDGVLGEGDLFTPQQLASAIERILGRNAQLDHRAIAALNNLIARLTASGDGGVDPGYDDDLDVDDDAETREKIEAFQRFLSQIRTWVAAVEELDHSALSEAVAVDSETIANVVDEGSQAQLKFLGDLVNQSEDYIARNFSMLKELLVNGGTKEIDYLNWEGEKIGAITLSFTHGDGLNIGMSGAVVGKSNNVFLPFDLTVSTNVSLDELMAASEESFPLLLAGSTLSLSGSIEDGQGTSTLSFNELSMTLQTGGSGPLLSAGSPVMRLVGDISIRNRGAQFSGLIELALVQLRDEAVWFEGLNSPPVSLRRFTLGGEFTQNGITTSSVVSVDLRNATHMDILSWLQHSGESRYMETVVSDADVAFLANDLFPRTGLLDEVYAYADATAQGTEGYLKARGYAGYDGMTGFESCLNDPGGSDKKACAEATLTPQIIEESALLSPAYQSWVKGLVEAHIAHRYGNDMDLASRITAEHVWVDLDTDANLIGHGRLGIRFRLPEFEESEDHFLDASFTLSSQVNIPELQSAQVTATIDRTSYRGGSLLATVAAEGRSYSLALSTDDVESPSEVTMRLFNAQGYELTVDAKLHEGELQTLDGEALINGEAIGSLELRNGSMPFIVFPVGDETIMESLL